jgi:hypothetical protein
MWQEFLDRWFDVETHKTTLEAYIAFLLCKPLERPRWAMLLRSDQGTGKGFLAEQILRPLLGPTNVNITTLEKVIGKFNGNQFSNKLIVLNQIVDDRRKTYNSLKDKITDDSITVEEKHSQPVTQTLYNGTIVFSNDDSPLYAEADDRRFYLTDRIVHNDDPSETQKFVGRMLDWLKATHSFDDLDQATGYEILSAWFEMVGDQGFHGCSLEVVPKQDNRIIELIVEPDTEDTLSDLETLLKKPGSQKYLWRISFIREKFPKLRQADVQKILQEAGYVHRENNHIEGNGSRPRGYYFAKSSRGSKGFPLEGFGDLSSIIRDSGHFG